MSAFTERPKTGKVLPETGKVLHPTPGPWTVGRNADNRPAIICDVGLPGSGFVVADCNKVSLFGTGDADANARLIASAPELRDALKESNTLLDDLLGEDYLPDHWRAALAVQFEWNRAALAKADTTTEGE